MPLEPGAHFDRYVISSLLGQGGMGEVYRAHDSKLQRSVALKVLRAATTEAATGSQPNTDGVARMMREARAAAALDHPNAVAIFDVGLFEGTSFIAMEFIDGLTLRSYIGKPEVPSRQRVRWLVDAARALASAHGRGLVHRDVKPENVMIREDGVVKVLDFGIARRTHKPLDVLASTAGITFETLTGKGILVGTPHYMSPEQMRGEQVTQASDVFSWGVVAYELLAGRSPWGTKASGLELVSQILSSEPEPLRLRAPEVPEAVASVVMHALAKAPAARPSSIGAILAVLEPHADVSGRIPSLVPAIPSVRPAAESSTRTQLAASARAGPGAVDGAATARRRRRLVAAILGAGAVMAAAMLASRSSVPTGAKGTLRSQDALSPSSAPSATPQSEEATSKSAEATSAYRVGVQASRDAADDVAMSELERAASLDASFVAAHLRRAIAPMWPDDAARAYYQKAVQLRATLSAHDRALMDAFEPWARFAPDLIESEHRLAAAASRYAADPELALLLCRVRVTLGDSTGARDACDGALRLDGGLAEAWHLRALAAGVDGDAEEATRDYGECLARAPSASACLRDLIALRSNDGSCDAALESARNLFTAYPRSASAHVLLAQALYGAGQPIESVRLAFAQASDWVPEAERAHARQRAEVSLDVALGQFDDARGKLRALDQDAEKSTEEIDHFELARARMELALEMGKTTEAAELAASYSKRRAAWTPAPHLDRSIYAEGLRYRAGALAKSAFDAVRATWIEREQRGPFQSALFGASPADRWAAAFAWTALTDVDAREALAALPAGRVEPALLRRDAPWGDAVGRVYLLAGRAAEALPFLRRAASSCSTLVDPIATTIARGDLGAALEGTGDAKGACAAYAGVLSRWGAAKPRSVTAERAKARAAALKCGIR